MTYKQYIFVISSCLAILVNYANAQDVRFTQSFFGNPLQVNPAVMGMNHDLKLILNYRNQWTGIDNGYNTYSFTTLYPFYVNQKQKKIDVGLNVLNDRAGAFNTTDILLSVGYAVKTSHSGHLAFAMIGGYDQKALNSNHLTFDEQYVYGNITDINGENILNQKIGYPDLGFGLMWYLLPTVASDDSISDNKLNAYIGVSSFHLNQPNQTLIDEKGILPIRMSYQAGIKISGEKKIDVTPSIRINTQATSEEVALGLYCDYNIQEKSKFTVATWYRKNQSVALLLGFEYNSVAIGYSYDITTSQISKAINHLNTHEITLYYKLNRSKNNTPETMTRFF